MIIAVIPAYNEEKTVGRIVAETKKYVDKVIVVDDCSKDGTSSEAKSRGAIVIRHKKNGGLGASLRDGLAKALELKGDVILTLDADGQHEPMYIGDFVKKINEGHDFVLGERLLYRYPLQKKIGNFFLTHATNFISGTKLKDTESGFRAFTADALKKLNLKAERYEIAVEIVFEAGRNNLKTANIPIGAPPYVHGVGALDGLKNFLYLLHRRKRTFKDYFVDAKYVLRRKL